MREHSRVLFLILIMTVVALVASGISIVLLYRAAVHEEQARLVEMAQSQARLIEAVAQHDKIYGRVYPGGSEAATLSQIRAAHENYIGPDETAEFILAKRDNDLIRFLLRHHHPTKVLEPDLPEPVPFDSNLAEPIRRALSDQSGVMAGVDYQGQTVLAAYEPVHGLDWGIVVKIDLAELQAPFLNAGIIAGLATLVTVLLGTLLFLQVTNPLLTDLAEREQMFRSYFEQAAVGIIHLAPDGQFIRVNQRFGEIVGYNPAELLQLTVQDITWPDDMEPNLAFLTQLRQGELQSYTLKSRYRRKDDASVWVNLTASAIRTPAGVPKYLIGFVEDISTRQEAEAELDWELEVNMALAEIYEPLIAPNTTIQQISATILAWARRLTGSEHGYVSEIDPVSGDNVGHTLTEMFTGQCQVTADRAQIAFPRSPDGHYNGLWGYTLNTRQPLFTNQPQTHPAAAGLPNGHIPLRRFLSVPVLLNEEPVGQIALANAAKDYTEREVKAVQRLGRFYALAIQRNRAEAALQQWQHIFEHAEWGIVINCADSHTLDALNPAYARMHGYTVEELTGCPILENYAPERQAELAEQIEIIHRQGHHIFESQHLRRDGTTFPVVVDATAVKKENGEVAYRVIYVQDITKLKQKEAEQTAIAEISRLFLTSRSLEDTFSRLPALLAGRFQFPIAAIELYDHEREEMVFVGATGIDRPEVGLLRAPVNQTIAGTVATTGQPIFEVQASQRADYQFEALRKLNVETFLGAPLQSGETVLGVLALADRRSRPEAESLLDTLQVIANYLAQEIKRKQVEERLGNLVTHLFLINDISSSIAAVQELDQLLRQTAQLVQQIFEYYHVALFLIEGELLKLKAIAGGYEAHFPVDFTQPLTEGIKGWVASHGQPIIAQDVSREPRFISVIAAFSLTQAEACFPLRVAGRTLGVLDIQSTSRFAFGEHDVIALQTLTDQLAIAIENTHLYEAIQQELANRKRSEAILQENLEELKFVYQQAEIYAEKLRQEITSRKAMTEALQKSEERFRQVIASISAHIYVTEITADGQRLNLYLSPHLKPLTGYPQEKFEADWRFWPTSVIHPDDRAKAAAQATALAQGIDSEVEYRLVRADGQVIWVRDSARVEQRATGKIVYGLVSDITERKEVEEKIQTLNLELEKRVADRTRELSALYEVTAVGSEALDLETMLARSLSRVLIAMNSSEGHIHLLDERNGNLYLAAHQGLPPEMAARFEKSGPGKGVADWVIEHGESLLIPDITEAGAMGLTIYHSGHQTYAGAPMRVGGQTIGVLCALRDAARGFSLEEMALLASIADQIGVMVENTRLRWQAERTAIMAERERLARELHDSVTQSLYSLTLLAGGGRRLAEANKLEQPENFFADLGQIAQQALKEMRLLVYELRPTVLEQEGLVGALQQRLDSVEGRAGIETRLLVKQMVPLPPFVEENLYRIAQEILNNALKHATATAVMVQIGVEAGQLLLAISDNGTGFTTSFETSEQAAGMGLGNIQERTKRVGGTLTVQSTPGAGTTVTVSLAIPDNPTTTIN